MIKIDDKTKCSGCTACAAACPQNCIHIEMDEEGFYYPYIEHKNCIGCDSCRHVCPVINNQKNRSEIMDIYGCQILSSEIRLQSTSGGMFTALAEYIFDKGGSVFAAGFNERMHVIHKKADSKEQIREMRGSKYTQSELGDIFHQINALIDVNQTVLFVGTPCQVAGLISYIGYKENLVTADLACYGVPSPGLYDKYIEFIENKYGSVVKEIYFRDKKYGYSGISTKIILKNGKKLEDNLDVKSYCKSMFSGLGLRPICYDCPFRSRQRVSDFTLGDFWEIGQYEPLMDDESGATKVFVNTEKGRDIFQNISDRIIFTKVKTLEGSELREYLDSSSFQRTCDVSKRTSFFSDMKSMEYSTLTKKYLHPTCKDRVNNVAKPLIHFLLPNRVSKMIFRKKKQDKMKT